MAKVVERPEADLYRTDYYRWLEEQATLLREGRLLDLDAENLIEEFEELAVGERASVESHAATIIEHLLKLEYSPATGPGAAGASPCERAAPGSSSASPPHFRMSCCGSSRRFMRVPGMRLPSGSRWTG